MRGMEHKTFALGDFALQKGGAVIPDAKLGYVTLGELNAAKDNVVVCPTWFTATPSDTAFWLTGPERALNPERWFIVIPNHFGAAVSSSPSNTPAPFDRGRFPRVTTYDNVVAQHRLLTEELGVERVRLVSSWSMGACQSYAWAALHPEMVDAIAPISGSARTANFNKVFLTGNIRAITGDANWRGGFYTADAPPVNGVRAMAARATPTTCSRRCGRGSTTTWATTRTSPATSTRRCGRSPRGRSSSRPRPTATSRRSTASTRSR